MKKIITSIALCAISIATYSQSGTNSPYSQYGLGVLSEMPGAQARGMNGLGLGFHEGNQINYLNPASYASIDSLSFIFDLGASGQITRFKENGAVFNAKGGNFEYAIAGLRLAKHLGMSFGLIPFTNVGYNFSNSTNINNPNDGTATVSSNVYSGEGGVRQAYLGLGWMPFKGLSIGANASYMWGSYSRTVTNQYSDATINTLKKVYSADFNSLHATVGLQYTQKINSKNNVTLGATYSFEHKLGADPTCLIISNNTQTGVADTAQFRAGRGMNLPAMLGVGLMWENNKSIKIGLDYSLQKWSKAKSPTYQTIGTDDNYSLANNLYNDRHKITLGGEFIPNIASRKFFSRIRYRAGASLTSSYLKINGLDGPQEFSLSAGVGIPIINGFNTRSLLNISAQWVRQSTNTFIKENTFRVTIGLTFNERWFAKWKVE